MLPESVSEREESKGLLRVSAHCYNTEEESDRCLDGVTELV